MASEPQSYISTNVSSTWWDSDTSSFGFARTCIVFIASFSASQSTIRPCAWNPSDSLSRSSLLRSWQTDGESQLLDDRCGFERPQTGLCVRVICREMSAKMSSVRNLVPTALQNCGGYVYCAQTLMESGRWGGEDIEGFDSDFCPYSMLSLFHVLCVDVQHWDEFSDSHNKFQLKSRFTETRHCKLLQPHVTNFSKRKTSFCCIYSPFITPFNVECSFVAYLVRYLLLFSVLDADSFAFSLFISKSWLVLLAVLELLCLFPVSWIIHNLLS